MQSDLLRSCLYHDQQCKLPESFVRHWNPGRRHSSKRRETQRHLVLELLARIHCSHLLMLCKQNGDCTEMFILKQIPFPGFNFCLFLNTYCRTMHSVVLCVGTILFLNC
jgi:hypothetical protein